MSLGRVASRAAGGAAGHPSRAAGDPRRGARPARRPRRLGPSRRRWHRSAPRAAAGRPARRRAPRRPDPHSRSRPHRRRRRGGSPRVPRHPQRRRGQPRRGPAGPAPGAGVPRGRVAPAPQPGHRRRQRRHRQPGQRHASRRCSPSTPPSSCARRARSARGCRSPSSSRASGQTALRPASWSPAIRVPGARAGVARPVRASSATARRRRSRSSTLAVVVHLDGDASRRARVALGSVAPVVGRIAAAEEVLDRPSRSTPTTSTVAALAARGCGASRSTTSGPRRLSPAVIVPMVRRSLGTLSPTGDESGAVAGADPRSAYRDRRGAAADAGAIADRRRHGDDAVTGVNGRPSPRGERRRDARCSTGCATRAGLDRAPRRGAPRASAAPARSHLDGAAVLACLVPAATGGRCAGHHHRGPRGRPDGWQARCSARSWSTARCSAGSASPASSWPAPPCSTSATTRPHEEIRHGASPATCAAAPATTRSSTPCGRRRDRRRRPAVSVGRRRRPARRRRRQGRPAPPRYPADRMARRTRCTPRWCSPTSPTPASSPRPRPRAEAVPGVVAVLTAADVPVNEYGLTMFDQPVLVGLGSSGRSPVQADVSRWEADHLAVVVAESATPPRAGAAAVAVEWEPLPMRRRPRRRAVRRRPRAPRARPRQQRLPSYRIRKGDVDAGWAAAEVVVEGTYEVPYQEHAYLQPEAALALRRRRGPGHRRDRRAVDPRGPGADRPRPRPAARAGARHLPGDRRGVRRARGHVAADRAGPGRLRLRQRGETGRIAASGRGRSRSSATTSATAAAIHARSGATRDGRDHRGRGRLPGSTPARTTTRRTRCSANLHLDGGRAVRGARTPASTATPSTRTPRRAARSGASAPRRARSSPRPR